MKIWDINLNRHSLARQYLYFTIAVISLILIIIVWVSFSTYHSYHYDKELFLKKETQKLVTAFDEKFTFIEHLLQFLGTKVMRNTNQHEKEIVEIIQLHQNNFRDEIFSWHSINFTNKDGYLIADSINGLRQPIKIDGETRKWILECKGQPWYIKFANPDIGIITKDYVISAAIGLFNKFKNEFVGYLSVGVSIEKLTSKLIRDTNEQISFIILDKNLKFILSSEPYIKESNFPLEMLKRILRNHRNAESIQLDKKLEIGQFIYTQYAGSTRYPYIFLVGQNKHYYYQELKEELLPKVILYITLGVIFTTILLFLGYQVIRPIIELGTAADNISKSKKAYIPNYKAHELSILANQLENIEKTAKNLRIKQNLITKANEELANVNEFIKSNMSFLSHELTNPIANILGFAQVLVRKFEKSKDEEAKEYIEFIHKAATHQQKQLRFFLDLFHFQESKKKLTEKEIDLGEIIDWNLSMIRHHILAKKIIVHVTVEEGLKMLGDEIMIGQLIQNLAANAAKYNIENGDIFIKAYSVKNKGIVIEFQDTGVGIERSNLEKIFKKFTRIRSKETASSLGYGIGLAYAKECAIAHGGSIVVSSSIGKGSKFVVKFPKERCISA